MSKSKNVKEIKDAEVIVDVAENEEIKDVQVTEPEAEDNAVEEVAVESVPKKKRWKTPKEFWNDYKKTITTVVVTAAATVAGTLLVESMMSDGDKKSDIIDAEFTEKDVKDNDEEVVFVETEE